MEFVVLLKLRPSHVLASCESVEMLVSKPLLGCVLPPAAPEHCAYFGCPGKG